MPNTRVHQVKASIGGESVLDSVSFELEEGGALAVVGPSGSGKTALLRVIAGQLSADGGLIDHGETDLRSLTVEAIAETGVMLVPQGQPIIGAASIDENLRDAGTGPGGAATERAALALVDSVLDLFPRLRGLGSKASGSLPAAEQQMLAIGRGLMTRPTLLMIDDLSYGLSSGELDEILGVLQVLRREVGLSVMMAEQRYDAVQSAVDGAIVLDQGAIIEWISHDGRIAGSGDTIGRFGAAGMAHPCSV